MSATSTAAANNGYRKRILTATRVKDEHQGKRLQQREEIHREMGNHEAGHAMVQAAEALIAVRDQTGQSAIEILEIACKPWAYVGDPEFDEEDMPLRPFGKLIREAFCPSYEYDPEADDPKKVWWDRWWDQAMQPFHQWRNSLFQQQK